MDDLDERRERAALNQSLFREDERIAELSHRIADDLRPNHYFCECLNTDCSATIELPFEEYERLRDNGARFLVLPGHEDPAAEDIVESTERYVAVEKIGVARGVNLPRG